MTPKGKVGMRERQPQGNVAHTGFDGEGVDILDIADYDNQNRGL